MSVSIDLKGGVALVTGGSHGIGRAIAEHLADCGARVHFTWRTREAEAREVASRISAYPSTAHQLDVRDPRQVDRLVRGIVREDGRLDFAVNNAGISRDLLLGAMSDEDFDDVIATNLLGPFHVIRAVSRPMMRQREGAIVNLSSAVGRRPERGQSNYVASKSGLNAMTRALAQELGVRGIRVNAVAPGIVPTTRQTTHKNARLLAQGILAQIPLRRFGEPSEVAAAVAWLLSDAASYVNGAVLDVSGGYKA